MKPDEAPDAVCARYANLGVKISVRPLDEYSVLIEGSSQALRFLGELFLAQAGFDQDCSFAISPRGPGGALFTDNARLGICIHDTATCSDPPHGRRFSGAEETERGSAHRGLRHPYEAWQGTPLWKALEDAIGELVENQDLEELTRREYIVGYLTERLSSLLSG